MICPLSYRACENQSENYIGYLSGAAAGARASVSARDRGDASHQCARRFQPPCLRRGSRRKPGARSVIAEA